MWRAIAILEKFLRSLEAPQASYTLVTKSTSTRSILLKVDGIDQPVDEIDRAVDFVTSVYERSTESTESQVPEY